MISIPVRLASRARLLAADVAAAFAPIVAGINGGLDASHFAPGRWLANVMKATPRSYAPVQIHIMKIGATGASTYSMRVAPSVAALYAFRWKVTQDSGSPAWDGTVKLYRNGVQIGTTRTLVGATSGTVIIDEALASAATDGDTTFAVEVNPTDLKAGIIGNLTITIECKAPHVR
jgi:hypothetical protein